MKKGHCKIQSSCSSSLLLCIQLICNFLLIPRVLFDKYIVCFRISLIRICSHKLGIVIRSLLKRIVDGVARQRDTALHVDLRSSDILAHQRIKYGLIRDQICTVARVSPFSGTLTDTILPSASTVISTLKGAKPFTS